MKTAVPAFLKKHAVPLLMAGGIGAYIVISGTSGTCGACSAITQAIGIPSLVAESQAAKPGDATANSAPAWTLPDLEGNEVSNTDFRGKVVLIDFWATWCPPCRMMIPGMVELQELYRDQGFAIVGISLDEEGPDVVKAFNKEFKVNYTSLMGNEEVVEAFGGIRGIPTSFLIDRQGNIVRKHVGYVPKEKLEEEIQPLL